MKPENGTAEDRMLDSTLLSWQIQAPLPRRFREQVWQRITREEARGPLAAWQQVAGWISQALARPSLAVGYVTLLLFLGLVAGYWQARAENERSLEDLSSRYVQMIDPYQPSRH
jgi:hypothetical protein